MSYFDDKERLWNSIPAIEFLTSDEFYQADFYFTAILDDVEFGHMKPQDSPWWDEFKELFGFENDGDVWDWMLFRDWADSP